jgi:superkiller protein 3
MEIWIMRFGKYFTTVIVFVFLFSCPVFSKTVAVMPFDNTIKDEETNWIGAGFADTLAAKLYKTKKLSLTQREQLSKILDGIKFQFSGVVDEKTAVETGKRYGVDVMVFGSYEAEGNTLRVNARFVDVGTGKVIDTAKAKGTMFEIFDLQDKIAFGLLDSLKIVLDEKEKQELEKYPPEGLTAYRWFSKGNAALNIKYYDEAIEDYREAIEVAPQFAGAYYRMGVAYAGKGDNIKAIEKLEKAINIDPRIADAYVVLALAYLNIANPDTFKAIELCENAAIIDPGFAGAYSNMGSAYFRKGDYDKAIEMYNKAISIDPKEAIAYVGLGEIYALKKNYDKTIEMCRQAVSIDPDNAFPYVNMGFAYLSKGDYENAIYMSEKAVAINPKFAEAYANMDTAYCKWGNDYARDGKPDKAIEMYEKAVSINPDDAVAYANMGQAYSEKKDIDKAVSCCKKAARLGNEQAQIFLKRNGINW